MGPHNIWSVKRRLAAQRKNISFDTHCRGGAQFGFHHGLGLTNRMKLLIRYRYLSQFDCPRKGALMGLHAEDMIPSKYSIVKTYPICVPPH
mmetsp:Transcript_16193/g.27644  ORF Transcript_16193/g.27644 Transcript_16193/m.27644 type:complete len:91 (-) Transcript_16193:872-1144(-)